MAIILLHILGATGHIGSAVAETLLENKQLVNGLIHDEKQAEE